MVQSIDTNIKRGMTVDFYMEQVVTKQDNRQNKMLYALAWVVVAINAALSVYYLVNVLDFDSSTILPNLVNLVIYAAMGIFVYIYKGRLLTEYEYTFTNGIIDFAAVYGRNSRKELGNINLQNIISCGTVRTQAFKGYLADSKVKRLNWFLNKTSRHFFFYFENNGAKTMIIIEPNEELVEMIKKHCKRGVFQET